MDEVLKIILSGILGLSLGLLFALYQYASRQVAVYQYRETYRQLQSAEQRLVALQQEHSTQQEQLAELALLKQGEQALFEHFKQASHELFENKSEKLIHRNEQLMQLLLRPLERQIKDFKKQINDNHHITTEKTLALKQEFEKVNTLYQKISEQSARTTRALMGDNKRQGIWGETHALQLLEGTGLRQNEQFFVQKSFTTDDGKRLIPDIVIKLPAKRSIILDVKVSLIDYMKYCNSTDPKEKEHYCKKHVQSIKKHIKSLREKDYAQVYALQGFDFVLMLLPVEGAFALAIEQEPSLFQEAYEDHIILTSPATLRAILGMIDQLWKNDYRNEHALAIARKSGEIYNKFVNFVEALNKVRRQLNLAQRTCDQAMDRLATGKGNLISKAAQLQKLGAATTKKLPLAEELPVTLPLNIATEEGA